MNTVSFLPLEFLVHKADKEILRKEIQFMATSDSLDADDGKLSIETTSFLKGITLVL